MRPESPRVTVDDISNQDLAVRVHAKFDLHVYQGAIAYGPSPLEDLKDDKRGTFHDVQFVLGYRYAAQLETRRNNLLVGPLRVVIIIIFEERFLQGWIESVALRDTWKNRLYVKTIEKTGHLSKLQEDTFQHTWIPFEEAASCLPSGDPLDWHHLTLLRYETFWTCRLHVSRFHTSLIEQSEYLYISRRANRRFSS